jgi:hypothetical protein
MKTNESWEEALQRVGETEPCLVKHGEVENVYLINKNDFVWQNGEIVKAKRKYGKHTRSVIKLTPDTPQ